VYIVKTTALELCICPALPSELPEMLKRRFDAVNVNMTFFKAYGQFSTSHEISLSFI
jgi:hypothetical protein